MAADHLRSLAMYITYAVEQAQNEKPYLQNKVQSGVMSESAVQELNSQPRTTTDPSDDHQNVELSASQIAICLLELYADLLCTPGDTAHITRFTKTVTNKVCLVIGNSIIL